MPKTFTLEERHSLEELLAKANKQRLDLDETLSSIETIVEADLDGLDEWVGEGIDVDTLIKTCLKDADVEV
jgi:hypothetical protein